MKKDRRNKGAELLLRVRKEKKELSYKDTAQLLRGRRREKKS